MSLGRERSPGAREGEGALPWLVMACPQRKKREVLGRKCGVEVLSLSQVRRVEGKEPTLLHPLGIPAASWRGWAGAGGCQRASPTRLALLCWPPLSFAQPFWDVARGLWCHHLLDPPAARIAALWENEHMLHLHRQALLFLGLYPLNSSESCKMTWSLTLQQPAQRHVHHWATQIICFTTIA
ncbi:uncharacterized protein LOC110347702 isoform X2 [Heterocephalus glaber]|nr:uncharacterized protein LOC110347702 isoform X2 [Heterocephalus glaber]